MNAESHLPEIRSDEPLDRLTTVRAGGRAEHFARASSLAQLRALLDWAAARNLEVNVVGSGSNLLVADSGTRGVVVKLDRDLTRIEAHGGAGLLCGGGARMPAVSARAAELGLAGIEFGVSIPGTVGGAVRMNANAYGGALAAVLGWVEIVTAEGSSRRSPQQLGFGYRESNLRRGEIVARAQFELIPVSSDVLRARLAELRALRHAAQPKGIRTFGSTFKNPDGDRTAGQLLAAAGCGGLTVGSARFSPKHANFVENLGAASTTEILELMAVGRARVLETFGIALEPEVQTLGDIRFPWSDEQPA